MSQPLIDAITNLFLRFVKLVGLLLRFSLANQLFKYLDHIEAFTALVSFDMQLHLAIGQDRNFKLTLWHSSTLPLSDRQVDRAVFSGFLFGNDESPRPDFFEQLLVDNQLISQGRSCRHDRRAEYRPASDHDRRDDANCTHVWTFQVFRS